MKFSKSFKLHFDAADCGVPISALLSPASMHDSRAAIPLSLISAERVISLYDVMDAAYCSFELYEHCRSLGHVPLIDHNPRGGEKDEFEPADAIRYNERSVAERSHARLKDEFRGNNIWVKGGTKVMSHLMFGILALSAGPVAIKSMNSFNRKSIRSEDRSEHVAEILRAPLQFTSVFRDRRNMLALLKSYFSKMYSVPMHSPISL